MNRVPDRKKLRWEYLKRQLALGLKATGLVALPFGVLMMVGILGNNVIAWLSHGNYVRAVLCVFAFIVIVSIPAAYWTLRSIRYATTLANEADTLAPITPDTLPVEEVLVRGAAEPQAGSDTLARLSTANGETPAQQLLRSAAQNSRNSL